MSFTKNNLIPVYHNNGVLPCFEIAFYYDHFPIASERIEAYYVTLLNKENPEPCDLIQCGNCFLDFLPNLDCFYKRRI